jgi:hypothetical protein
MTPRPVVIASLLFASIFSTWAADVRSAGQLTDPQEKPVSGATYPPQISGTVVDTSSAVIAGATVLLRT